MDKDVTKARQRLVTASLRLAAAERGGLDTEDAEEEEERALMVFEEAAGLYCEAIATEATD